MDAFEHLSVPISIVPGLALTHQAVAVTLPLSLFVYFGLLFFQLR